MTVRIAIAVAILCAVAAAAAGAASTTAVMWRATHSLVFHATIDSVANRVTVTSSRSSVTVNDASEPIVLRGGCRSLNAHTARCPVGTAHGAGFKLHNGNNRMVVKSLPPGWTLGILLGRGNDKVVAVVPNSIGVYTDRGADTVTTGSGDDQVVDHFGGDRISTGAGNDYINPGGGDDYVDAGPGDDYVPGGGPGDDTIKLGDGNDNMFPSGHFDPNEWPRDLGSDTIDGGPGNDQLSALDPPFHPVRDYVTCGPGDDSVEADTLDVIAPDCEHVDYPQPRGDCISPQGQPIPCDGGLRRVQRKLLSLPFG